ncbi:MAG: preprotein translocase subunit SecE [Clostridiales bacterium]|nr:preprotein translocase subunit SecE [Clostridiales bacterium]
MSKAKDNALKKTTEAVKKPNNSEKKSVSERFSQWFRELKSELKKVVWPTKEQTVNNTVVALVVTFASAIVLWGFDSLAKLGVEALISLVG